MSIEFRRLLPKDSLAYRTIRLESLKEHPDAFGAAYADQLDKEKIGFQGNIENQDEERFVMGAFDGKQLIGIVALFREVHSTSRHKAGIYQMYVKSSYSGRQIGKGLMRAMIRESQKLEGLEQLNLEVYAHNTRAKQVYLETGFEDIGTQKEESDTGRDHKVSCQMLYRISKDV